ncbi:MAG: preprotein translocase subunit YajC [Lachnospiraceae bacterium]|jgi:preprotein translocase subunit YajC|nr:preprotein translocase subunit YajC [Lachnospiraceae bacterium]
MGILLDANVADPTAAGGAMGSIVMAVLVYGLFFLAMWFFLFRPQGKEKKRMAAMLASLAIGDVVLTTSGFYGIVIDISEEDSTVIVEFGNNKNCRIPMEKSAISRVEKADGR